MPWLHVSKDHGADEASDARRRRPDGTEAALVDAAGVADASRFAPGLPFCLPATPAGAGLSPGRVTLAPSLRRSAPSVMTFSPTRSPEVISTLSTVAWPRVTGRKDAVRSTVLSTCLLYTSPSPRDG